MSAPAQIEEWIRPLSYLATGESVAALVLLPVHFPFISSGEQRPLQERAEVITTLPDGVVCWLPAYYPSRQGLNTITLSSSVPQANDEAIGLAPGLALGRQADPGISEEARQISGLPNWLRPVSTLPWSGLSLIGSERKATQGWMNPESSYGEEEPIEDEDDNEPTFMAHGEFLE
jgi:hypothetical protein